MKNKNGLIFTLLVLTAIMIATAASLFVWFWFYLFFMANYHYSIRIGVSLAVIGILSCMIYRFHILKKTKEIK